MPVNDELYVQPERIQRNPLNGRFLKGFTPHNKGKRMSEYMSAEMVKYVLKKLPHKGNSNVAGWNKKEVIGIKDGKIIGVFKSGIDAGNKTGICAGNIRLCCREKRKSAGGIKWFWEKDIEKWYELIK
jgi:hypothetical protein